MRREKGGKNKQHRCSAAFSNLKLEGKAGIKSPHHPNFLPPCVCVVPGRASGKQCWTEAEENEFILSMNCADSKLCYLLLL